jgi:phage I-like protein
MNGHEHDAPLHCEAFSAGEGGAGLKTVKLCGWGQVESTHGTFTVDEPAAAETVKAFEAHGASVPIDIEHETLAGREPAAGARGAIGWIEKVFHEVGRGLFGLVKWSDKGRELIRSDAFRYLSPVFVIRKDDRRVVGLHSAAVTTKPALVRAELLAASQGVGTHTVAMADMGAMVRDLAEMLKLDASGDAADVFARCKEKIKAMMGSDAVAASVRTALGLRATADKDAITLALAMRTSAATGGGAEAELAAMKEAEAQRQATAMVQSFVSAGKLNPNDKPAYEAAMRLALSDPGTLDAIFKNAPVQCPPGRTTPPTNRQMAIFKAERAFRDAPSNAKITSVRAFVDNSLREAGLARLSDDEARELVSL